MEIEDKRWAMRIILPEHRAGLARQAEEKCKVEKPQLDAQQIEDMEITVAELMEFGAPLAFELYDEGYIFGAVHYVDHIRKEFRVKDAKGDTNFVRFADIINVKNAPSG
ncbi:YolD-like family protein [Bacillus subtilis]|uniref:YolD-like family protein n=1 Tax=Bacillus subtilis TaxID=1423 RepID=UPI002DBDB146|nr:YolD-like family protein [Bacillus subtilis]MEC2233891.1 YolD-like family protein [Bacillus subtilis]